jgi:hypothetical protein
MKARKNKEGYMGSASRIHRVKKGKGSYNRKKQPKEFDYERHYRFDIHRSHEHSFSN